MGRYDGEDYAERPPCRPPSAHRFGMNGRCFTCRWDRDSLQAQGRVAGLKGDAGPTLGELQREIIANRERRGWRSAHDNIATTLGLAEEVGEFERARKRGDTEGQVRELADILVYALGGMEILGADALVELRKVVEVNKTRTHDGVH